MGFSTSRSLCPNYPRTGAAERRGGGRERDMLRELWGRGREGRFASPGRRVVGLSALLFLGGGLIWRKV